MSTRSQPEPVVLGIDLGTTGAKVVAFGLASGRVLARATQEHRSVHSEAGAHEQDPRQCWSAVATACRAVMGVLGRAPASIGLTGQMHSLLLLNADRQPVRPAMTWADRRVGAETTKLAANDRFRTLSGNDPVDAFTAPKLAWVARYEPDRLVQARHLLLAKDWIGLCLTGELATDVTDAMGTLLWDTHEARWAPELFEACGASADLGIPVWDPGHLRGRVTPEASQYTGIPVGTPVVAGAGDVSAAAYGGGASKDVMCLNVGTAAQVMGATKVADAGPGFAFGSAAGVGFICMASVYAAGASVRHLETTEFNGLRLEDVAVHVPAGAGGTVYLPFMFGASVPRRNDAVRGGFFGAAVEPGRPERAAAALEGVAYACAEAVEAVASVAGRPREVTIVGGVTASRRFRESLAAALRDSLGAALVRVPDAGSALGACLLAAQGVGMAAQPEEVLARLERGRVEVSPQDTHGYVASRALFSRWVEQMV